MQGCGSGPLKNEPEPYRPHSLELDPGNRVATAASLDHAGNETETDTYEHYL